MATAALRNLRWAGREGAIGNPVEFYDPNIKEANSQSFVVGDLVTVTPGVGTVSEWTANGAQLSGIALTAATNVTSGNIPIRIQKILPGEIYIGNLYSGASAVATAITHLGVRCGLRSPSAGVWVLDVNEKTDTNVSVQIVGFVYGADTDTNGTPYIKALGDTGGEVYFKFLSSRLDTADGSTGGLLDFGGN